jgi:hypothetical protein
MNQPSRENGTVPIFAGAIDCDVHPLTPGPMQLAAYMDDHWRETVQVRGIDSWQSIAYPPNAPLTVRADWRAMKPRADSSPEAMAGALLDRHGFAHAILNSLFPVGPFRDAHLAAAFARAANDWLAAEWLSKDARLRGAALIPIQSSDLAVAEIERRASDRRFVQILLWVFGEQPLGKPVFWPIYAAAEQHGFAVAIHAGSSYYHPVTGSGWPSHYVEDYAAQALGFHTQLGSLISEGVFVKFPKLKVVLAESGVTWLPPYLWRLSKFWRGVRNEVPWIDRDPIEMVRSNVRFTLQPFDAPRDAATVARVLDQLGGDELLLFSSDFPHWQFEGDDMLPPGLSEAQVRRMLIDNPRSTYARL